MGKQNASDSEDELNPEIHKQDLQKLKKIDPDFYNFLEENDENLLNFNVESENSENEHDEEDDSVHVPGALKADSDESDFEEEGGKPVASYKVTLKMVSEWQTALQNEGKISLKTLISVLRAFNAAMLRVTTEDGDKAATYKVEGSSVFNAVIQLCVLHLPLALKKFLHLEQSDKDPRKCKHFVKIKHPLISYLNDLMKLLGGVTSTNILTVLLKHLHQMSMYVACFGRISRLLLKKLIPLWSSGEETVRVLAFLCILRIMRNQQATLLNPVLKAMYLTYVKNCKFVSPTTWPGINFMRRSLVEIFSLDLNVSYHHVFLYIRQLAIHLRNAIVVQKVENRQAVYNWQFINSLHLWVELLSATSNKPQLQPLIYPLVMVIMHTIKLVPTHQYYPLRFHCVEILMKLSKEANTFVPIMPFLIEILTSYDFNKKHKKVSMKPMDLSCILRLAKSQLTENGFKDAVIEKVYSLLLEYMTNESYNIAFPDIAVLAIIQIRLFLKTCTISNYTKKLRQLLDKIEENSKFIENERSKISFSLNDNKLISAWEVNMRNKGTPLSKFFENWNKINKLQKRKKITNNDELADELPVIKRPKKVQDHELQKSNSKGPLVLFPSDSEDEKDEFVFDETEQGSKNENNLRKPKKIKKVKKKKAGRNSLTVNKVDNNVNDEPDVVKDLSVKDW